ncbi:MAG: hypothetical protein WC509_00450 [Candidatus Izemoplasmatales bacterium]
MKRFLGTLGILGALGVLFALSVRVILPSAPAAGDDLVLPADLRDTDVYGGSYRVRDRLYVYVDRDAGAARVGAYERAVRNRLGESVGFVETDRSLFDLMMIKIRLLECRDELGIDEVSFYPELNSLVVNVVVCDPSVEAAVRAVAGFDCEVVPEGTTVMVLFD